MLDVAIRKADGTTAVDWSHVGVRTTPPLPVAPALHAVLPDGLRRGSTVSVAGSISLLLALLGTASAGGAWCALVGFPRISAEAACEYGVDLAKLALIPAPGAGWTTAVGALLDAVDIVAVRPPASHGAGHGAGHGASLGAGRDAGRGGIGLPPGDIRRLAARARSKDAVLVPYVRSGPDGEWPGADVRLTARDGVWTGPADGSGRLRARRIHVAAGGRGIAARPRSTSLWLPADGGGVEPVGVIAAVPLTPVIAPVDLPA